MQFVVKLYEFLSYGAEIPKIFGLFHLISALIIIILTTLLCIKCKNSSEKTERRIVFWIWILLLLIEFYKQFIYLFTFEDNVLLFDYDWAGFPFQLCSAPLYVLPFIAFLPSGKLRERFAAFSGTFLLLGGIAVYIYPGNVFVSTLGINFQTMIWHGSQIFLGVYLNLRRFLSENPPKIKRYFFSSIIIFLSFVFIALILNIVMYYVFISKGTDEIFNMFFISPYFDCLFPVLDIIQAHTPYPLFLLSYILILSLFSFVLIFVESWIVRKTIERRSKTNTVSQ